MAAAGVSLHVGREANSAVRRDATTASRRRAHHSHQFGRRRSTRTSSPATRRAACSRASTTAARRGRRGRQARAGLLLPHVPDRTSRRTASRSPSPRATTRKQYELLLRTLRGRLARARLRQVRPDPQPQDRHEQPRPLQHRQHRHELRLPRGQLRAPPRDHQGARARIRRACSTSSPTTRACRRTCRTKMQPVGPAEGRVHRQRQLAAPDLRPRGPADDRRLRDDRARAASGEADAATPSAWAAYNIDSHNIQRYVTPDGPRAERRRHRASAPAAPYPIATARSCRRRASADNLLVPVCLSRARTSPTARSAWSRCS